MLGLAIVSIIVSVAAVLQAPATPSLSGIVGSHCTLPHQLALDPRPLTRGPLRFRSLHCQWGEINGHGSFEAMISPDGRALATLLEYEGILRFMPLREREASVSFETGGGTFTRFATHSGPYVQWSSDSRFMWAVRQERMRPGGGWGLTPLQPIRVGNDSRAVDLPELRHPAGSLDGLLWAGGDGLAVAQFGTRGSFYRPERANPEPMLAIVDASRGVVRQAIPLARFVALGMRPNPQISYAQIGQAMAIQTPQRRVRALLSVAGSWIEWNEGAQPRRVSGLPNSLMVPQPAYDGRHLLVVQPPPPDGPGIFITSCGPPRHGPCPPRNPREEVLAALYDVETGRRLWTLRRVFDIRDRFPRAAISPDGRFALIGLEPRDQLSASVALVSLRSGEVLQIIPAPGGNYALGFARGGRLAWLQSHGYTALYDVRRR